MIYKNNENIRRRENMRVLSFTVLFLASYTVLAADSKGNYAIWGAGNKSCHSYNLARSANDDKKFRDYTMGYLTAFNHGAEATYSISRDMNLEQILAWIDELCELKPIISFDEVLISFIQDHYEQRMKFPPGGFGR
jgi:hypothetical protein